MGKFLLCAALVILAAGACGGQTPEPADVGRSSSPVATEAVASPTVAAAVENGVRIPAIGVYAPLSALAVGRDGMLPDPAGTDDVGMYDLSSLPGFGGKPGEGNLVVFGRNDSGSIPCRRGQVPPPCTAVFWHLGALVAGDEIVVDWERTRHLYRVSAVCNIESAKFNDEIVRATERPSITLLTKGGSFNASSRSYSHHIIVVGRLSGDNSPAPCPTGSNPGPIGDQRMLRVEGRLAPGTAGNPFPNEVAYSFRLVGYGEGPLGDPGSGPVRLEPALPNARDGIVTGFQRQGAAILVPFPPGVPAGRYILHVRDRYVEFDHQP